MKKKNVLLLVFITKKKFTKNYYFYYIKKIRGNKKMKSRKILFAFSLLSLIAFSMMLNVLAADFSLDVAEDDEFIWEVKTVNEAELQDLGMTTAGDSYDVGSKMKIQIEDIDSTDPDYWKVYYDEWDFTDQDDWGSATGTYYNYIMTDPDDVYAGYYILFFYFVPIPTNSYLANAFEGWTGVDVDDNTVALSMTYMGSNYKLISTYSTDNGVMTKFQITQDGEDIYMFELLTGFQIPGYELAILLGVTAISTIGLIYIMMRKK